MNWMKPRRRLFFAAAGGLVGFLVLLVAWVILVGTALAAASFPFGGGTPTFGESLILYGFVPMIISLGAAVPAWTLGAKFWHGVLAGIIAMVVFVLIDIEMAPHLVSYGAFNIHETTAAIITIFVSVAIAILGKNRFQLVSVVILIVLTGVFLRLRSLLSIFHPQSEQTIGFVISLLAWIMLPAVTTFSMMSKQNIDVKMEKSLQ